MFLISCSSFIAKNVSWCIEQNKKYDKTCHSRNYNQHIFTPPANVCNPEIRDASNRHPILKVYLKTGFS